MIKGVNRNIIEISDTGSDCFERVILFVRPESMGKDGETLCSRARQYMAELRLRPRMLEKGRLLLSLAKWGGVMALGAALAILVLRL